MVELLRVLVEGVGVAFLGWDLGDLVEGVHEVLEGLEDRTSLDVLVVVTGDDDARPGVDLQDRSDEVLEEKSWNEGSELWKGLTYSNNLDLLCPLLNTPVHIGTAVALRAQASRLGSEMDVDGVEPPAIGSLPRSSEWLAAVQPSRAGSVDASGVGPARKDGTA